MAKLTKAVFVRDPARHTTVLLQPGEQPEPRLAVLVTNPDCWEDGQVPSTAGTEGGDVEDKGATEAAPVAKKTAATRKSAATKPARPGRR